MSFSLSNQRKGRNVSAFLRKTYSMLEQNNDAAIRWAQNGVGFIIISEELLCGLILPRYFKHGNYSSFIRQLNMYDFHKIRNASSANYFYHEKFIRHDLASIAEIRRKPQKKKGKEEDDRRQIQMRRDHHADQIHAKWKSQSVLKRESERATRERLFTNDNIEERYSGRDKELSQIEIGEQESEDRMSINQQIGLREKEREKERQIRFGGQLQSQSLPQHRQNTSVGLILTNGTHFYNRFSQMGNFGFLM